MNKFFALTLLALVASVSCNSLGHEDDSLGWSQAAADGESDGETDLLLGHERLFTDFCVNQRQKIESEINEYKRESSAYIMKLFFGNANEITSEVIGVQKDAVAQLSAQLAKPDAEIVSDEKLSEDQIAKLIEEGKRNIQQGNSIAGIVPASKSAVSAMLSAANSAIFTRIAKARAFVSAFNLYDGFKKACDKVAKYEEDLSAALEAEKSEIAQSVDDAATKQSVEATTIVNLNCATTKTIVRLNGFCDIVQAGHTHFFKMLGMADPLEKLEQQQQ